MRPTVVRVIDVPSAYTLPELHLALQAAMGWTESHLHQFVADGCRYGVPDGEDWDDQQDEVGVLLVDLPARFTYLYDFGDGWEHEVEVLGPGGDEHGCPYGEGSCPPEDCGGPGGFADLLAVLADPAHPEHQHLREWTGNRLGAFDQAEADRQVRRMVGEVPGSVRLVLDLAKGGVKLTPGGRLPRRFVRAVQEQRPGWAWSQRPASIEEDLPPLAALHDLRAGWGCCGCSAASWHRRRPQPTTCRSSGDCVRGFRPARATRSSPSGRSRPWSPPARGRGRSSPRRCSRNSARGGRPAASR